MACSLLAALAGVLLAGSTGYVDRSVGRDTELDSITAALLGGATFSGGEGSFLGGAIGSLLLASLFTIIVLHGWSTELQLVAKGIVLVGALAVGGVLRRARPHLTDPRPTHHRREPTINRPPPEPTQHRNRETHEPTTSTDTRHAPSLSG